MGGWEWEAHWGRFGAGDLAEAVPARWAPAHHKRQPGRERPGFLPCPRRVLIQGTRSSIGLTKAFFQSEFLGRIALLWACQSVTSHFQGKAGRSAQSRAGNRFSRRAVVFSQERHGNRLPKLGFLETTTFNLESICVTRPFVCSDRAPQVRCTLRKWLSTFGLACLVPAQTLPRDTVIKARGIKLLLLYD